VAGALARTLAKNPADRFNPAAQFVQALTAPARPTEAPAPAGSRRAWWIGAGVVAVAAAAWLGSRLLSGRTPARAIERIAVLPMDNQTGDSAKAFFADGMTRELIGVLTDAGVRVLGHRAVAPYRGSTLSAPQIAKELGVDAIVTGAVLQAGDEVQVAAELIDPASGENLWARTFSRPASGVVSLQHEIASEIARGIQARLTPEQEQALGAAGAVDPAAYAEYLLGQEQTNLRTPDGYVRGVAHLTRSLTLDSTFAPAWATLAIAHAYGLLYQTAPTGSARPALERAVTRAIALDARLGDPYFALGLARVHTDWNFTGGEEAFRQGLQRSSSAMARALYAWTGWELGQFSRMIATSSALVELEPTTAQWRSDLAFGLWSGGDSKAARVAALQAIAADSTFYEAHDLLAYLEMEAGDAAAAARAHQNARRHAGGDYWFRPLSEGLIAAVRSDRVGVRRVLAELANDPRFAQRAVLHEALGELDEMYRLLIRAVDARDADALWILNAHPNLYPHRGEPRYQQLLARVGLPEAQGRP
jgi:TolB-like protein